MAWWESEEQTKQKKKAHGARNWGDPDKGYGVGGGRGPGPGRYQKKDYSFPEIRAGASSSAARRTGITRPPGADIPQIGGEPDKGPWDRNQSSFLRGETRPRYDPTAFRGYGNRADSSYTREPTGEGWGYGMGGGVPGRGLFPALSGKSPLELIDPGGAAMEEAYRISRPPAWSPADQWAAPLFSAIAGVVNPFDMLGPFDEGIRSTKALKALIETRAAGKLTQKGKDALKSFHAWLRKNNIKVPGKDLNAEAYLVQLERNKAAAAEAREAYWKKIDDAARTREYERSGISDFGPPQPEQGFLEPGSRSLEMDRWDDPSVWVDTSGNVHSRALRNVADEVPRSWFDEGLDYSSDNPWWLKEDALPSDW